MPCGLQNMPDAERQTKRVNHQVQMIWIMNAALIRVLGDGTTIPGLQHKQPVILISNGSVRFGKYNRTKFVNNLFYLEEPENSAELANDIEAFINEACPSMKIKKHPVHLLCPVELARRMQWPKEQSEKQSEKVQ